MPFQSDFGTDGTAEYTLNDDGSIRVVNKEWLPFQRRWNSVDGSASVTDESVPNVLAVRFSPGPPGEYRVLYTDYENYAVVYNPTNQYCWVLGRTTTISSSMSARIFELIRAATNLSPDDFVKTQHGIAPAEQPEQPEEQQQYLQFQTPMMLPAWGNFFPRFQQQQQPQPQYQQQQQQPQQYTWTWSSPSQQQQPQRPLWNHQPQFQHQQQWPLNQQMNGFFNQGWNTPSQQMSPRWIGFSGAPQQQQQQQQQWPSMFQNNQWLPMGNFWN